MINLIPSLLYNAGVMNLIPSKSGQAAESDRTRMSAQVRAEHWTLVDAYDAGTKELFSQPVVPTAELGTRIGIRCKF